MIGGGIIACLVFAMIALYPVSRDYYLMARDVAHLQSEYDAVIARNEQIEEQTETLKTSEGIQDRAREQFGWTANGETAVNITGLPTTSSPTALPPDVPRGYAAEEADWWAGVLDAFFSVPEKQPPAQLDDPFTKEQ